MSKQRDLTAALDGFCSSLEDVQGAVLASRDGLTIASSSLADAAAIRLAAVAATVQAVAEREIKGDHTVVRAAEGCVVVYPVGSDGVLALQTAAQPNVGLVNVLAPDTAGTLAKILAA